MQKITEIKIIAASSTEELEAKINAAIIDGFQPYDLPYSRFGAGLIVPYRAAVAKFESGDTL